MDTGYLDLASARLNCGRKSKSRPHEPMRLPRWLQPDGVGNPMNGHRPVGPHLPALDTAGLGAFERRGRFHPQTLDRAALIRFGLFACAMQDRPCGPLSPRPPESLLILSTVTGWHFAQLM